MIDALAIETPGSAPVEIETTDDGLTVRWRDGDAGHELTLAAPGEGVPAMLAKVEELLDFCYRSGFEDASNPRFFVP